MEEQQPEVTVTDLEKSPTIGKWAEALAAAQAEMENASADSQNPHFRSKYADLASITDACRLPLAKHKIARHQAVLSRPDGTIGVRTMLAHASGEFVAATSWCKPERAGAQAMGSVTTYLRRYSLAAAVGVAQEDDDAEGAEVRPAVQARARKAEPAQKPPPDAAPPTPPASKMTGSAVALVDSIRKLVQELNWESLEVAKFFGDTVGKVKFSEMSEEQLKTLKAAMETKAKERAEAA